MHLQEVHPLAWSFWTASAKPYGLRHAASQAHLQPGRASSCQHSIKDAKIQHHWLKIITAAVIWTYWTYLFHMKSRADASQSALRASCSCSVPVCPSRSLGIWKFQGTPATGTVATSIPVTSAAATKTLATSIVTTETPATGPVGTQTRKVQWWWNQNWLQHTTTQHHTPSFLP